MEQIPFYGAFMAPSLFAGAVGCTVLVALALGYLGAPLWAWTIVAALALVGFSAPLWLLVAFAVLAVIFNVTPLRRLLVSAAVMKTMKALQLIPKISQTERTALEAGVVWMEAELFSGRPDFKKLMSQPYPELSAEEQKFIDGPVDELCAAIDEWKFWKTKEMSDEVMDMIKKKGFLGMIIPKEYGGLGFSNAAHSEVIHKITTRSGATAIMVMVPNSLGPAELLVHYGTDKQKEYWLPRLADGTEIPCFGLTEPQAGSDAGSITSEGVLFKGDDGKIYMRLNWRKRWITLAAISTVLGLAFRLRDPDNLLGRGEDLGITCALIPSNTEGVVLGRRHDPLGVPFYNCPMEGKDVVVEADEAIIGGLDEAGQGWQMLMESLGAGRGISLPAQGAAGAKSVARVCSAHASIRKQFGLPIGKFEGVEEPLARIAGGAYFTDAMRNYVLSALDQGIKPPVVTAIAKYNATEEARRVINDGMDVMGGAGISMGPKNQIAIGYVSIPISITVEGANILTRTLMIFGQGALRAHPYAFSEVDAIEKNDLNGFDKAFWGHIGHIIQNTFRALMLSVTRGRLAGAPMGGPLKRYYQKLAWSSASFAILADLAMGLLGGKLKVKEKLTGRFADILSWMFITTAVLRRWEAEGRQKKDLPLVHYSLHLAFYNIQQAFDGIYSNMDVPFIGWIFSGPIRWWSRLNFLSFQPNDALTHKVARALLEPGDVRDRLTKGIYLPKDPNEALARLEETYLLVKQAEELEKKLKKAMKEKKIPKGRIPSVLDQALEQKVLSQEEYDLLKRAEKARWEAIQVDDFTQEEYLPGGFSKEEGGASYSTGPFDSDSPEQQHKEPIPS